MCVWDSRYPLFYFRGDLQNKSPLSASFALSDQQGAVKGDYFRFIHGFKAVSGHV